MFVPIYPAERSVAYVKTTNYLTTNYYGYFATDPTTSLTGPSVNSAWITSVNTEQKFNIDIGRAEIITRLRLDNYHHNGNEVGGIKNFIILTIILQILNILLLRTLFHIDIML